MHKLSQRVNTWGLHKERMKEWDMAMDTMAEAGMAPGHFLVGNHAAYLSYRRRKAPPRGSTLRWDQVTMLVGDSRRARHVDPSAIVERFRDLVSPLSYVIEQSAGQDLS